MSDTDWIAIDGDTWRLEDAGVRLFLLEGATRSVLVDAGMHIRDARERAERVSDKPLSLINTHADVDHVASDAQFERILVSPFELCHPTMRTRTSAEVTGVWDGDVIDLGDRELEVIALPGHTPGSIALLDRSRGALFSGDPIQRDNDIFMFGPLRSLAAYVLSLRRLLQRADEIRSVWPCHGTCPVGIETASELLEGALRIERGEIGYTERELFGHVVRAFDVGCATLLLDAAEDDDVKG